MIMSNTKSPTPQTSPDPIVLITKAGKLNYSIEKTCSIVHSQCPGMYEDLHSLLTTSGTKEFEAYSQGRDMGMFDVESGLYDAAAKGDADAQKALQNLRQERITGEAIRDRFFPEG